MPRVPGAAHPLPPTSRSPNRLDTSGSPSWRWHPIPTAPDGTRRRSAPVSSRANTGSPTSTDHGPTSGATSSRSASAASTQTTTTIARSRADRRRRRGRGYNLRMRSTLILLVRHGQTPTTGKVLPGQASGLHLAEEGQRQANVVAARIDKLPKVAAAYASQLERARETALPIGRNHGLAVRVDSGLADGDVGEWTGPKLRRRARKPEWPTAQRHPHGFRFPRGESSV